MLTSLSPVRVAIAGEALIDLVAEQGGQFQACLGGASFNLTRALARQSVGVAYLNPLSQDRFGEQLTQALVQEGVVLTQKNASAASTSLAVVQLDQRGHPSYAFYREGVADRAISAAQLNADTAQLSTIELICTGCLALSPADRAHYLPWLATQRSANKWVVIDVNMRPSVMPDLQAYRDNVMQAIQFADVIKASDEDLEILGIAGEDPLVQAAYLFDQSPAELIAITLGKQGALMITRSAYCRAVETAAVEVVDTVGAGDSFLAGMLANLLAQGVHQTFSRVEAIRALDLDEMLKHAIASASINVQRQGCQPPNCEEVQAWIASATIQVHPTSR